MMRQALASMLQGGLASAIEKVVKPSWMDEAPPTPFSSESWLLSVIFQADECMRSRSVKDLQDCLGEWPQPCRPCRARCTPLETRRTCRVMSAFCESTTGDREGEGRLEGGFGAAQGPTAAAADVVFLECTENGRSNPDRGWQSASAVCRSASSLARSLPVSSNSRTLLRARE